ncbi:putative glycerol-3-phosphate acyltransferase 3 [Senna tora]|uniref:Putative glycerol-3-phosphate acyltransferase 3 n=1 Tax=Senna tora TaxID=362788 RepID=A0A834WRR5_9FABA|nr:putative glycerol-3-phosphate acyltransferase 3 [Senna tora]
MATISHVHKTAKMSNKILVFHLESALLRSNSLFPYFMLVAYEAGGLFRSLLLFLSYPLVWLLGEQSPMGFSIMVFLTFFGVKKKTFRIGSAALPKFFLEDVGCEGFEAVMSFHRKVASSNMPRVMVEAFLKEYIEAEAVVAREIKSFWGYYLGVMHNINLHNKTLLNELHGYDNVVGIGSHNKYANSELFCHCKKLYLVNEAEKRSWDVLPREKYPKPLIFHDGRLAFRPTPSSSLAFFMWLPLGLCLSIFRFTVGILLPFNVSAPLLAFSGTRTTLSKPHTSLNQENEKKEGTTCREPYLLRFSPLFAELTDDIVPVAVNVKVSMFYGTTASGNKALDPFYHFLNPNPTYCIKFFERLQPWDTCQAGGKSRIEVANYVQSEIGRALGFACTSLTRKDKYMSLAGHDGISSIKEPPLEGKPCH